MLQTTKVPQWFLRLYLSVKGRQDVLHYSRDYVLMDFPDTPEHPIRWLWEGVQNREDVTIGVVHSWDRQIGRGGHEDPEEWCRWIYYAWNYEQEGWEITEVEYMVDGYDRETIAGPRVGYVETRAVLENRQAQKKRFGWAF